MRSHENTPYVWVDAFNSDKNRDIMQVIDKQTFEVVARLRPSPGKVAAHAEFTRDGKYALVSIWKNNGELVVYDASSLEIVKRPPMKKPSENITSTTRSPARHEPAIEVGHFWRR